ncbi:patatin-like protein [Marinibaculum pumilum]|uniref:Patatin-like protein n=1 Tax=Marinibaculum pumilum TaxID=1766165 RepID=A0ABV7L539_9PROT
MRETELRLALVCYGGISLAVYMHGITKEVLKLVRASAALRPGGPAPRRWHEDSEPVYRDLLQRIGAHVDLRVVVDVVAGASAGGINGIILARALAHDLPLEPLTALWLKNADISELIAPENIARPWSKWYMRPVIWGANMRGLERLAGDTETQEKLSTFLRSRWFKPPFEGTILARMLLDGCDAMDEAADAAGGSRADDAPFSLMPPGHRMDLFVSVTDFYGYRQLIRLHDPAEIVEREHRHVLDFTYRRALDGREESDFGRESVPGLVFAARATSSYPGAFPPAQIAEIDQVIAARGRAWPRRGHFLAHCFEAYRAHDPVYGTDPEKTAFIDGSVLKNKPFAEAIAAIRARPADRQVDRRIVYIEPTPRRPAPPPSGKVPGWFRTIRAALSDIPRNEPVRDDLAWISEHAEQVKELRAVIAASWPRIEALVQGITGRRRLLKPRPADFTKWRNAAHRATAREVGFLYGGYRRRQVAAATVQVTEIVTQLTGWAADGAEAAAFARNLADWQSAHGLALEQDFDDLPPATDPMEGALAFLRSFDVDYRLRRVRGLIQAVNERYAELADDAEADRHRGLLNDAKRSLYQELEALRHMRLGRLDNREALAAQFDGLPPPGDPEAVARTGSALQSLAAAMVLETSSERLDALLAGISAERVARAMLRPVHVAYIGFAFIDLLMFTMTHWEDVGELDEIRVDRISPEDADSIRPGGAEACLKGIRFGSFGAFFSRASRENDYLWGRLHAVDRLMDIVCDAAGPQAAPDAAAREALKRDAFRAILAAERPALRQIPELFDAIEAELAARKGES